MATSHVNESVWEIAYNTLKGKIVSGEIPAGGRIIETAWASYLHISRTPLREALRCLEQDGLVDCNPRHGVIVKAFSVSDVEQIYAIRNALELLTLPFICQNADAWKLEGLRGILRQMDNVLDDVEQLNPLARQFHASYTAMCGQPRIIQAIQAQDIYINRFTALAVQHEQHRLESHREHYRMVALAENGNLEELRTLTAAHLEASKMNCLAALRLLKDE